MAGRADMKDTQKQYGPGTESYNPAPLTDGQTSNRRPHYADDLWISPDAIRKLGGNPDTHDMVLRRDPRYWNDIEFNDRLEQAVDSEEGLYPLRREDGSLAKCGDLIRCMKPKKNDRELLELSEHAIDKLGEAIDRRSTKSFEDAMHVTNRSISRWNSQDPDIDQKARESHYQNVADGIIGPTSRLDYNREIASEQGRADLRKMQARFLNPGSRRSRVAEGAEGDRQLQRSAQAAQKRSDFASGTSFPGGAIPPQIGLRRPPGFKEAAEASRSKKG